MKGDSLATECSGIIVMKWRDKGEMSFISMFHDSTIRTVRGTEVLKPK
jgi:hypothetical protein